jgi:hypothetical protein
VCQSFVGIVSWDGAIDWYLWLKVIVLLFGSVSGNLAYEKIGM